MALLEARGIVHRVGDRVVLDGLDLTLEAGELIHLRGENGAGKSTLLRILAGLVAPQEGTVRIDGRPLDPGRAEDRAPLAYVPAQLAPSGWLTVEELLEFRAALRSRSSGSASGVAGTIEAWGLTALRGRPMEALSEGERRQVVLAAAFTAGARVLLLDEPTLALDRARGEALHARLRAAAREGGALVTSHIEREGLPGADRLLTLAAGRIS